MRPTISISLAGLVCIVIGITASPVPMFGPGSKASSSSSKGTVASGKQTLIQDHHKVMREASERLKKAADDKMAEYYEINQLRLKGHPIQRSIDVHDVHYSNIAYLDAVKKVDANHAGLKEEHAKLLQHMRNLSNYENKEEIADLIKQANKMHNGYLEGTNWAIDHEEDDEDAHGKIKHIIESEGTHTGPHTKVVEGKFGFNNKRILEKWGQVHKTIHSVPHYFTI